MYFVSFSKERDIDNLNTIHKSPFSGQIENNAGEGSGILKLQATIIAANNKKLLYNSDFLITFKTVITTTIPVTSAFWSWVSIVEITVSSHVIIKLNQGYLFLIS